MLNIRTTQMQGFQANARKAFLEKLAAQLNEQYKAQVVGRSNAEFLRFVEATVERAESHGMCSKDQIRRFAVVVIAARDGIELAQEPPQLQSILDDDGSGPREKLSWLEDWLLFEEGR